MNIPVEITAVEHPTMKGNEFGYLCILIKNNLRYEYKKKKADLKQEYREMRGRIRSAEVRSGGDYKEMLEILKEYLTLYEH